MSSAVRCSLIASSLQYVTLLSFIRHLTVGRLALFGLSGTHILISTSASLLLSTKLDTVITVFRRGVRKHNSEESYSTTQGKRTSKKYTIIARGHHSTIDPA